MDKFFIDKPKECEVCNGNLEEKGYYYEYKGEKITKALCYNCSNDYVFDKYVETKVLTYNAVSQTHLELFRMGFIPDYNDKRYDQMYKESFRRLVEEGTDNEVDRFIKKMQLLRSFKRINQKIKEFEEKVWFKGLQDTILKSSYKGVSAKFDNVDVLTYTMCGRTIITIEDKTASVSSICIDNDKNHNMGFRGICAKEEDAIRLLDFAIKAFEDGKLEFVNDGEVSYM